MAVQSLPAQAPPRVGGEVLVQLHKPEHPDLLMTRWLRQHPEKPLATAFMCSEMLWAWCVRLQPGFEACDRELLEWIRRQPEVLSAQFNLLLEPRAGPALPNDSLFNAQWHLYNTGQTGGQPGADLGAPEAWAVSTGGSDAAGNEVVIAVVDGGVDREHPDLAPNLWTNAHETPGDSSDNDLNGYVDDFYGWNVFSWDDNIEKPPFDHGTQVFGVAGAQGNNQFGVSGVAWSIKVMYVNGTSTVLSLLQGFDYVLKARKTHTLTNGARGAYVVALNCSWGINYGKPVQAPLWCAALDSLGAYGILSVAPVANIPVNIDEAGDLPCACPSSYLITTTGLDHMDQKTAESAWGQQHVDLGAYSKEVFTTSGNNSYKPMSGTSMASPQIAGALGLLYASPCPTLSEVAEADPEAAALWARNLVLGSVQPNGDLEHITSSGGRLHVGNLMESQVLDCSPCPPPFDPVFYTNFQTDTVLCRWQPLPMHNGFSFRWRQAGTTNWAYSVADQPFGFAVGLSDCMNYEFSMQATCDNQTSDWSVPASFSTNGCCSSPSGIRVDGIGANFATIAWASAGSSNMYRVRWRPMSSGDWNELPVNDTLLNVFELTPCTEYLYQVQSFCDTGWSAFSPEYYFTTAGCGPCVDAAYCVAKALQPNNAWIQQIDLDNWQHWPGPGGGYINFGVVDSNPLTLFADHMHWVQIFPGSTGSFPEHFFGIFLDWNADGIFQDPEERVFDPGFAVDGPVSGFMTVPSNAAVDSQVRLRVMMKHKTPFNAPPLPCEEFSSGVVLDFCANISTVSVGVQSALHSGQLRIFPNPVGRDGFQILLPENIGVATLDICNAQGRRIYAQNLPLSATRWDSDGALLPTGVYFVTVHSEAGVWQSRVVVP